MFLYKDDISKIIAVLEQGGIMLYPTDTIWGIGCDATNAEAVQRIFELKQRPQNKSFVILVADNDMLKEYVHKVHPKIDTLLSLHTRPLTIIYPQAIGLAQNALADNGSVAVRIVQDDFCRKLITAFGKPLVATSANISGADYPPNFGAISSEIISGVDYVVKHRQDDKKTYEPSVIAKMDKRGELDFIRE